jgi:two-component system, LytTR family, sensor kinase
MKNNCNLKKQQQPGTGMGLQNIFNRYKLLSGKAVMITNTAEYFLVKLPQLKNS